MTGLASILLLLLPLLIGALPRPQPPPAAEAPECLAYDPELVRLSGVIEERTFPAGPVRGEGSSAEEPDSAWVLRLFAPICTTGWDEIERPESGVREIQVVVDEELFHALHVISGRRVTVTGTLFHSHGGNQHTPVLIILRGISGTDLGDPGFQRRSPALLV